MSVNEIKKQPGFCWWCYSDSIRRFVREIPDRSLREAVIVASQEHRNDGGLIPTQHEHSFHPRPRPRIRAVTAPATEEEGEAAQ